MANREAEPVFSGRRVNPDAQIQALLDLVAELKEDLNNLRTDFRAHDHGNTGSYVQAAITLRASANSFSGTAEASTAVIKPVSLHFLNG